MATEPILTIRELFAAREAAAARRRAEDEALAARKRAELKAFTDKVMAYQITPEDEAGALAKIRKAFEDGEREVMLVRFPSAICADGGRRINNHLEGWQDTLPGVFHRIYEWWERNLQPGGFTFLARILDYPDGMPGDVGIFISWPSRLE